MQEDFPFMHPGQELEKAPVPENTSASSRPNLVEMFKDEIAHPEREEQRVEEVNSLFEQARKEDIVDKNSQASSTGTRLHVKAPPTDPLFSKLPPLRDDQGGWMHQRELGED